MTASAAKFDAIALLISNGMVEEARQLFEYNHSTPLEPTTIPCAISPEAFDEIVGPDGLMRHTLDAVKALVTSFIQEQQRRQGKANIKVCHQAVMDYIQNLVNSGQWQYAPGDTKQRKGKSQQVINDGVSYALSRLHNEGALKREQRGCHTLIAMQWIR